MTPAPTLLVLGDPDAPLCEDGVCRTPPHGDVTLGSATATLGPEIGSDPRPGGIPFLCWTAADLEGTVGRGPVSQAVPSLSGSARFLRGRRRAQSQKIRSTTTRARRVILR